MSVTLQVMPSDAIALEARATKSDTLYVLGEKSKRIFLERIGFLWEHRRRVDTLHIDELKEEGEQFTPGAGRH